MTIMSFRRVLNRIVVRGDRLGVSNSMTPSLRRLASTQQNNEVDGQLKEFVDYLLRQSEQRHTASEGPIQLIEVNRIAANSPCEDQFSVAHCQDTDTWLAGVFDGHAGPQCSRHVSRALVDYLCIATQLHARGYPHDEVFQYDPSTLHVIFNSSDQKWNHAQTSQHVRNLQEFVTQAAQIDTLHDGLQSAFDLLDAHISQSALSNQDVGSVSVAGSGSCACVALVNGADLHIANVGDSKAVLASVAADTGGWTARKLSRSHHIENPGSLCLWEVQRVRSAHPMQEYDTVLRGGRLLGQLYPLRAFGDVAYKWTQKEQERVLAPFYGLERIPPHLETPPYLVARPDVFYHRLTPNDRFLILASDGLWDFMSPEAVVRLLFDHCLGKQTLEPYKPEKKATVEKVMKDLLARRAGELKQPLDDNSSTHIMRYAIGGTGNLRRQYNQCLESLQLPEDVARNYRDDITIQVIHFNVNYLEQCQKDMSPLIRN